jgi:ABC-type transport system involved in multi-copper enzyme maturation permease subunit
MIFGPIFRLELLTIGRRRRYILLRLLYAFGLLIALYSAKLDTAWYFKTHDPIAAYSKFAQSAFALFASVQLGCILLLTPAMVAGTIAAEHERKTIDYLLTTQLRDSEITLGKFSARLLTLGAFLLTALPIVVMMMMLGGISPKMVYETFLYAVLTLIATASLSLWISASSRYSRSAVTSAYLSVIVLCALPLPAMMFPRNWIVPGSNSVVDVYIAIVAWNPIVLLVSAFDNVGGPVAKWATPYYASLAYGSFSLVCLAAAVRALRRTYVKSAGRGAAATSKLAVLKPLKFKKHRLGSSPMLWKELSSQQSVLRLGWIGRTASAVIYIGAYVGLGIALNMTFFDERASSYYGFYDLDFLHSPVHEFSVASGAVIGSLILLLITARAAGSVTSEKEQDSWLTLLSTPLEGQSIVAAKIGGALYSVRYWYLYLVVVWFCCILREPKFALVVPALIVLHLVLGWLCAVIGVIFSVICKNSLRSIGNALLVVGGIGVGLPLLAMGILDIAGFDHYVRDSSSTFIYPAMMAGTDVLLTRTFSPHRDWWQHNEIYLRMLGVSAIFQATIALLLSAYAFTRFDHLSSRIEPRATPPNPPRIPTAELEALR